MWHLLFELLPTYFIQLSLCHLKATLSSWQDFETERETLSKIISNTSNELHKELIFNSLDSLRTELEHNKVCVFVNLHYLHSSLNRIFYICSYRTLASFLSAGALHQS